MNFWRGFAVVSTVAVLVGCTTQRDTAQGDFDYVELTDERTILVPQGMEPVVQTPDFVIPKLDEYAGPVGADQSIRSPRQVMPLVPGSRVEEGNRASRIWFDAVDDMNNVAGWVWRELEELVAESYSGISHAEEMQRIETERFTLQQGRQAQPGFMNRLRRQRIIFESEQSLTIHMDAPPHGRSAMLEVSVENLQWLSDGQPVSPPPRMQRQIEADFLNELSMRLLSGYERERVASVRATRSLRHAESPQGEPAYALDTTFDAGWVLMPGVFDHLGFFVEDLNQRDGTFYVDYQPGGRRGWFSRLAFWRSRETPLGLPRGSGYEFEVDEVENVFYIVIRHDGELLSEEQLDDMFEQFAEAFSEHAD